MLRTILTVLAGPICSTSGLNVAAPPSAPSAATSSFEFASNPWLNEFNFLTKLAKQARHIDDDGLGARGYVAADTAGTRALSPSEAADWNGAVDFFARVVVPDRLGVDSLVQNINDVLARAPAEARLDGTPLPASLATVLQHVMPVYRAVWWPAHDRRNQAWIAAMQARLAIREACLARRAERVFRAPWPASVHVDATVYANWFGAYSEHHPSRITVAANAKGSQDDFGLEVLLHETAHGMLAPLDSALAHEAARQRKELPEELSHLVLFYTAGALMREEDPEYVPFAESFGVWRRNALTRRYGALIDREWQPYLAGKRGFDESVAALVRGLP